MDSVVNFYHYLNYELADKTTTNWFLIGSYVPLTVITISYILFVKIIGPKWMENREAFNLDKILPYLNLFHIILNLWYIHKGYYTGFHDGSLKFSCQPLTDDPETSEKFINAAWVEVFIKIIDLTDTIIFILRKKNKQASFLHVYHHISMCWLSFIGVKYNLAGGMTAAPVMLNCSVHVIMYLYYFLSSFGPSVQKILNPMKPFLTTIQMVQFIIIILHFSQIFLPWCHDRKLINFSYILLPNVLIYFYLFNKFYKKSYYSKKNGKILNGNAKVSNDKSH